MEDILKEILQDLEDKWDTLTKKYMSMKNKYHPDYYLFLGKAASLGETIDFIKEKINFNRDDSNI